jgi:hypothetical protein
MHLSPLLLSLLRQEWQFLGYDEARPSVRFTVIHFTLELLHWRSCLTQTKQEKERMAGGRRSKHKQSSPAMEVNSFGDQRLEMARNGGGS